MSQKEKENIISLISTIIVSVPYFVFVLNKYNDSSLNSSEELKFWAKVVLLLIPIRIVVQIAVFIVFSIIKAILTGDDKEDSVVDERDKLIELKGDRNSTNTFTFAVIASMIAVVGGGSISVMFGIMVLGGFLGELIGILSKIYYYRKGL